MSKITTFALSLVLIAFSAADVFADDAAIKEFIRTYVEAFNKQDLDAASEMWAENAIHLDRETGKRTEGRAAIRTDLEMVFKDPAKTHLAGSVERIRFIRPNVGSVNGTTRTTSVPDEDPDVSLFSAILVQHGDKWQIDSIEEMAVPQPVTANDALRDLNRPVTLPADIGNRPGLGGGNRPGINWPNRPGGGGSGIDWPSIGDNINIGDINVGNNIINHRPSWINIHNDRIVSIRNQWGNRIGGIHTWHNRHPDRIAHWRRWGDDIRYHWGHYHDHHYWFQPDWWYQHQHGFAGWHYYHGFHNHSWRYWWTIPTFTSCVNWFTWSAPTTVWEQPIYYDCGQGGNVVYENNVVYIDGQQVATADEFAQTAAALATVPPPENKEQAAEVEWMPLGTFAVAADEKDVDPSRVMQLALSQEGIISGTLYNTSTDQAHSVQGQVDKETQRVAFRIGESEDIVAETGLYNLTQNESSLLVHLGAEKVETYLLVRLEAPEDEQQAE